MRTCVPVGYDVNYWFVVMENLTTFIAEKLCGLISEGDHFGGITRPRADLENAIFIHVTKTCATAEKNWADPRAYRHRSSTIARRAKYYPVRETHPSFVCAPWPTSTINAASSISTVYTGFVFGKGGPFCMILFVCSLLVLFLDATI